MSPILKKSDSTPTAPVTVTSTPKDAEDIICIEDKTIWSRQAKQQREDILPLSPPPQTAHTTEAPSNNESVNGMPTTTALRSQCHQRIHTTR